jgi:hypothetical protein
LGKKSVTLKTSLALCLHLLPIKITRNGSPCDRRKQQTRGKTRSSTAGQWSNMAWARRETAVSWAHKPTGGTYNKNILTVPKLPKLGLTKLTKIRSTKTFPLTYSVPRGLLRTNLLTTPISRRPLLDPPLTGPSREAMPK